MKIRILDNSIRLRLSQSEVSQLDEKGVVLCTTRFSPTTELHYAIQNFDGDHIHATFESNEIKVLVPSSLVRSWANSNEISLSAQVPIDTQSILKILVEKDFKCLSERKGEDESDLFPNPDKQHLNC
jgi:hypothetical protein